MKCSLFKNVNIPCSCFLISSALIVSLTLGLFNHFNSQVYVVCIGANEVGIVEDASEIELFVEDLTAWSSNKYGLDLEFNENIIIRKEVRPGSEPDALAVRERIKQLSSFRTDAYMIQVDGQPFVPVACRSDLDLMIEALTEEYAVESNGDSAKVVDVDVSEDLTLQKLTINPDSLFTAVEAASLLKNNGSEHYSYNDPETELMLQGFTNGLPPERQNYNAGSVVNGTATGSNSIKPAGPEIDVTLKVKTVEEVTEVEVIPFSKEYIYDDDMLITEKEIKEPGQDGKKEIIYQVERQNGVEIDRKVISEEVIKEPQAQVEIKGRKNPPARGSGSFTWPVQGEGTIYNAFSSGHPGIDIHIAHGTNVLAADDGIVTYSGYGSTQGKYLILQHGRYWTLYLHNSSHLVSVGDRVSKGQPIAKVGTTGRAFGPHLHFEIRVDDGSGEWDSYYQHRPVDPMRFYRR